MRDYIPPLLTSRYDWTSKTNLPKDHTQKACNISVQLHSIEKVFVLFHDCRRLWQRVHNIARHTAIIFAQRKSIIRSDAHTNTRISLNVIEAVLFSAIGCLATSEIKFGDLTKIHKNAIQAERCSLISLKSNAERAIKKDKERFKTLDESNEVLNEIIKKDLEETCFKINAYREYLSEIDKELVLY